MTFRDLFDETAGRIEIPAYQRAYTWGKIQHEQWLDDLYHLGQFIFERAGERRHVVDGQQRLTTAILFLAAIVKLKEKRGDKASRIPKSLKRSTCILPVTWRC
jgi:uncharacterized protein with ParB-like and HNH nuclease domain